MFWFAFKNGIRLILKMFRKKEKTNTSSRSSMAGPGYIILNGIRMINITSLLMVAVASWVMIVVNVKTNHFFFFDAVAHFITSVVSMFLIISECNLFKTYFAHNWPKFSNQGGFFFLGVSMIVLGFNILSNLNKEATSAKNLGMPAWRIVISSGIVASIVGLINIVATFIFCDTKQGITARQVRSHGAALPIIDNDKHSYTARSNSTRSRVTHEPQIPFYHEPVVEENRKSRFNFRLPIRISHISRPVPVDPQQFSKWHNRSQPVPHVDRDEEETVVPDRASPVYPDIQRPPTAAHPMYQQHFLQPHLPPPPPASSRYSVVSNVTRF